MQTRSDDVFRALADEQRRLVVRYLMDADGTASYRDVADYLSAHGADEPEEAMLRLRHTILPILAEAGLLRYDSESERISYRSHAAVEDVLAAVEDVLVSVEDE
jgi:isopentenyl phosphate kinase